MLTIVQLRDASVHVELATTLPRSLLVGLILRRHVILQWKLLLKSAFLLNAYAAGARCHVAADQSPTVKPSTSRLKLFVRTVCAGPDNRAASRIGASRSWYTAAELI